MSIVNQTLRELDARAPAHVPAAALRAVPAAGRRGSAWRWASGGTLLVIALAVIAWVAEGGRSIAKPDTPAPVARLAEASPPVARGESVQPAAKPRHSVPDNPALQTASESVVPPTPVMRGGVGRVLVLDVELTVPNGNPLAPPQIEKRINAPSREEAAEAAYRRAVILLQKGREDQARPLLDEVLALNPAHVPGRQALATLLIEAGQTDEAEAVLSVGRSVAPHHAWFAMGLARLQAARGEVHQAIATLRQGLDARGVDADYHATLAALLVQADVPAEAVPHYRQALVERPGEGIWWAGLSLALAAQGRMGEARSAYERALLAGGLPEKLAGFLRAKLAE